MSMIDDAQAQKLKEGLPKAPEPEKTEKKKSITQVFHPQNSRTGMNRPARKKQPQGQSRPGSCPECKAAEQRTSC